MLLPPPENAEIYNFLYSIETALRELIIEALSTIEGPIWYKRRLPGDVLEKYRKGREYEKSISWTDCIPHNPIYYVDFPDLRKIIERDDNWRETFESIFSRKEVLSILVVLEPIRNKIAHNRKASHQDLETTKGAYSLLSTAIGSDRFATLATRCTARTDIPEQLAKLRKEAENAYNICQSCTALGELTTWKTLRKEWWFDESYLGNSLDELANYFQTLDEYSRLPRTRGSGYKIEAWVKSAGIDTKYSNAQAEFRALLGS